MGGVQAHEPAVHKDTNAVTQQLRLLRGVQSNEVQSNEGGVQSSIEGGVQLNEGGVQSSIKGGVQSNEGGVQSNEGGVQSNERPFCLRSGR